MLFFPVQWMPLKRLSAEITWGLGETLLFSLTSKSGSHSRGLRLSDEWNLITPTNAKSTYHTAYLVTFMPAT